MLKYASTLTSALFVLGAGQVQAAPHGTLVFDTPYAVVSPTDSIDVWVTFTLDGNSPDLVIGNGDEFTNGTLDINDYPSDWLSYDYSRVNVYFGCSGTFTQVCDPGAYEFNFNLGGPDSMVLLDTYAQAAGQSVSYKFGTFTPVGGAAPAGTYTFIDTGLMIEIVGTVQKTDENGDLLFYADGDQQLDIYGNPMFDGDGNPIFANAGDAVIVETQHTLYLADTQASGILFERTVTAVPEAETWMMLLAGLGLVGFMARRRA